jgi:hypothetical protein
LFFSCSLPLVAASIQGDLIGRIFVLFFPFTREFPQKITKKVVGDDFSKLFRGNSHFPPTYLRDKKFC